MVKTKNTVVDDDACTQTNYMSDSDVEKKEFEYEKELNSRITNRKRRNAITPLMADEIKNMLSKGNFF